MTRSVLLVAGNIVIFGLILVVVEGLASYMIVVLPTLHGSGFWKRI
jgi:hypothetical protein